MDMKYYLYKLGGDYSVRVCVCVLSSNTDIWINSDSACSVTESVQRFSSDTNYTVQER